MSTASPRVLLVVSVAVAALLSISPIARPQIQVSPALTPVGTAASGTTSMAWFHQPSSNTVVACQAVASAGSGISGIQCASAKLP
jgi:hypothetical protein